MVQRTASDVSSFFSSVDASVRPAFTQSFRRVLTDMSTPAPGAAGRATAALHVPRPGSRHRGHHADPEESVFYSITGLSHALARTVSPAPRVSWLRNSHSDPCRQTPGIEWSESGATPTHRRSRLLHPDFPFIQAEFLGSQCPALYYLLIRLGR